MTGHRRQRNSDLPAIELLLEPGSGRDTEACSSAFGARPARAELTHTLSSTRQRRGRLLRIATVVVAATMVSAAVTHRYDQWAKAVTPPWITACRAAIDATAQLQRQHDIELDEAMQYTWALVAGVHVQPAPNDTSIIASLQRDADNTTRDCITPPDPAHVR